LNPFASGWSVHRHKYGGKTSEDVRRTLLSITLDVVREARTLAGVTRIAMLGSLLGSKLYPKDADLLVTITSEVDFNRLAALARRLKGRAQAINSGADVFLADDSPQYLGRICHYRECFPPPRMSGEELRGRPASERRSGYPHSHTRVSEPSSIALASQSRSEHPDASRPTGATHRTPGTGARPRPLTAWSTTAARLHSFRNECTITRDPVRRDASAWFPGAGQVEALDTGAGSRK
jgi:hypothetical protein